MSTSQTRDDQSSNGFGTLGGVFTPCTLTILGVIMFLRFGYVVGQAGLWCTLAIVAASKLITMLTTLSLSAIATNTRVKGGGAYYLISRSLGVEFGGAIGLVFFLAQAISVSMYTIGFAEAAVGTFPEYGWSVTIVATVINVVVFGCVFIGAGWTIKIQYFILAMLVAALISFYYGTIPEISLSTLRANALPNFGEGNNFFTMFALFFPAVTGIMAGANMSGDLRNPARSIPVGTLCGRRTHGDGLCDSGFLPGGNGIPRVTGGKQPGGGGGVPLAVADHRGRLRGHLVLGLGQHDGSSPHPAGVCSRQCVSCVARLRHGGGPDQRTAACRGCDVCHRTGLHLVRRSQYDCSAHHDVLHDYLRTAERGNVLRSDHEEPQLPAAISLSATGLRRCWERSGAWPSCS